jgi:hypothetical protein
VAAGWDGGVGLVGPHGRCHNIMGRFMTNMRKHHKNMGLITYYT